MRGWAKTNCRSGPVQNTEISTLFQSPSRRGQPCKRCVAVWPPRITAADGCLTKRATSPGVSLRVLIYRQSGSHRFQSPSRRGQPCKFHISIAFALAYLIVCDARADVRQFHHFTERQRASACIWLSGLLFSSAAKPPEMLTFYAAINTR